MPFLTEPEPPRGLATQILPGIRRIVAANPSVMTYHGTNTYLLDRPDGLTVLDPGPDDRQHVQDILAAAGATPIRRIVLTHTHSDHYGAAAALREATGAPTHGYKISGTKTFAPDVALDDGDEVAGLAVLFTPGHAKDHLCFGYDFAGGRLLFSGDHVMSWSSSIVNPPDGDMSDYYRSLELLLGRDEALYLGGHGPALDNPRALVAELLAHRQKREATILAELSRQPWRVGELAERLYAKTDLFLKYAAQRNVLAHIEKLQGEGVVEELVDAAGPLPAGDDELARMQHDALRRFALLPVI